MHPKQIILTSSANKVTTPPLSEWSLVPTAVFATAPHPAEPGILTTQLLPWPWKMASQFRESLLGQLPMLVIALQPTLSACTCHTLLASPWSPLFWHSLKSERRKHSQLSSMDQRLRSSQSCQVQSPGKMGTVMRWEAPWSYTISSLVSSMEYPLPPWQHGKQTNLKALPCITRPVSSDATSVLNPFMISHVEASVTSVSLQMCTASAWLK